MTKTASGKAKFFLIACATVKPNGFLKPSFVLFTLSPSDAAQFGGRTVSAQPPLEIYLPVPRFSSTLPLGTYIIVRAPFSRLNSTRYPPMRSKR